MTRRSLIQRVLLILGMPPLGVVACASREATVTSSAPSVDGPLSTAEIAGLVAFGEVIVEGRTLAPAERQYLVDHIEEGATRSPDYLARYRAAVATLHGAAGREFARLDLQERIDLVDRHRLASPPRPGEDMPEAMRALRMRVVPDLIRGYYRSPAGWAAVGYDSFPGRCGELTRYTRPEA